MMINNELLKKINEHEDEVVRKLIVDFLQNVIAEDDSQTLITKLKLKINTYLEGGNL